MNIIPKNKLQEGYDLYFETITHERNERFCPVLQKNVLMDVNEKNCAGCAVIDVKCCNESNCTEKFGECLNKVLKGSYL